MYDKGSNTDKVKAGSISKKRRLLYVACLIVVIFGIIEVFSYWYTEYAFPRLAKKEDQAKIDWAYEHLDEADSIALAFIDMERHVSKYIDIIRNERGYCYLDHKSIGVEILRKMAESGFSNGQYALGRYYMNSNEQERGAYWYSKAIGQGNTKAMNNLASYYWNMYSNMVAYDNSSIEKTKEALSLWRRAALLGNSRACLNLGNRFSSGVRLGIMKNLFFYGEGYREVEDNVLILSRDLDSAMFYWNRAIELDKNSSEITNIAKERLERLYE